ncbi:MAG: trypsin-like peptidase domain-containing protein [Ruminococcus sp.]|nr:trypsin-like peptidase domain-containing protein [Ruminococcus sp.]
MNPYENNYDMTGNTEELKNTPSSEETENISSSVNPEDTEHINFETIDYTPDEYYQENFSSQNAPAENTSAYYDGFYSQEPRAQEPAFNQTPQGYSANPYSSYTNPYPQYSQPAPQPKPKRKKEKKPITRSALAAVLVCSILCSALIGAGGGFLAASMVKSNESVTVSKSEAQSSSYVSSSSNMTTTQIVNKAADSVVEITTEQVSTGSFNQQYIQKGAGSGVIISKDGYIITNYHVIEGASHITVTLRDKTEYTDVEVVGTYSNGDIALLKIKPKKDLTAVTFGDSSKIQVGDYAVVIGNPLGQLGGSVTDGIISALDREVTIDNETMNLLQTNAEISPGNSGGGLFNGNGELIGIVNAKSSSDSAEGIGFAIPINDVQDVLSDLKQYGYVKGQIDLGMSVSDISSTAQLWMYGASQTGVYVTGVNSGSNAAKAGFQTGDIITKVNDTEIKSTSELNTAIKKLKVGDKVTFGVTRGSRTGTITMTLQEYTRDSATSEDRDSFQSSDDDFWDIFG